MKTEFYMNVNQRENIHGLIQNITYFTDSKSKVLNSKIILQYFISRKYVEIKKNCSTLLRGMATPMQTLHFFSTKEMYARQVLKTSFRKR